MDWTKDDADKLRRYLIDTESKLLRALKSSIPAATATTIEAVALEAKERKGAEDLLTKIDQLAEPAENRKPNEMFVDTTVGLPK